MQELLENIYIESAYSGVVLGAIRCERGLIMVDAPFRAEDIRDWRTALQPISSGERLLVNLDAHFDRTLGVRGMDCTMAAHQKVAEIFHGRPVTFKAQPPESGAEWELTEGLGSIRWAPPEITFTSKMTLYWDSFPVLLESHPGPATGSIWVVLPQQGVVFVGDAVVSGQPPFLASADLTTWLETLNLLANSYSNHILISGRSGVVVQKDVQNQIAYLEKASAVLERLKGVDVLEENIDPYLKPLLECFNPPAERAVHYLRRLRWGVIQYLTHRTVDPVVEVIEE